MPGEPGGVFQKAKRIVEFQYKHFSRRHGQQIIDILEFPLRVVVSPFTIANDIIGSAPRGFGVPEFISKIAGSTIFVVATLGTYDIAFNLGRKFICPRNCQICSGWQALQCTMCKGLGTVQYQIKSVSLKSGEVATAEHVADAIADNRAELVHIPSTVDLHVPLPSKDCPTCDGSGVMGCSECKDKLNIRLSTDEIMDPPWKPYEIMRRMDYPYELITPSMKDPSIASFWLFSFPEIIGGFNYDDEVKEKIWRQYKDSIRYDQLRDVVARREPGWEHLQEGLISINPVRAKDDPVIVRNIPYYKAKKALEEEVKMLDPPPRPLNWGELNLPLNASSWSSEDLKDPKKLYEMTVLLNAQREIADEILDAQWETNWRQNKLNEMLEDKVRPHLKNIDNPVLLPPIMLQSGKEKASQKKRWWFF